MTDRENLINMISDISKDVYGFRLRLNFSAMSDAELETKYESLIESLEVVLAQEKKEKEKSYNEWVSHINFYMAAFNISISDAIRWDMDSYKTTDVEEYCYESNLPYSCYDVIKGHLG